MNAGYFDSEQLSALYKELDRECAEFARDYGQVSAAQRNKIAARLMEAARKNPPSPSPLSINGARRAAGSAS